MAQMTDKQAQALKPTDSSLAHGGIKGLFLVPLKQKGTGKWVYRFTSPQTGTRRIMGLGSYPGIGIKQAGELAYAALAEIAAGIDPLEAKKCKSNEPEMPNFQEAAEILHKELVPGWRNPKHGNDWINSLIMYAFKDLGSTPISDVTPKDIANVLRPIWLEKAETASRVKQRMHAVMSWAWAHGYVAANPVDVVHHLLPKQGDAAKVEHQPAMPWEDVPAFVTKHLGGAERNIVSRNALAFLILTAARSGEVRGAKWQEVNFESAIWTIPAERMKAREIHRVPLSDAALDILKRQIGLHQELIFPSPRDLVPLSDNALTMFLRKHQAHSDIEGRTATAHGFRSSFRDWASHQQYPRDWAERALAHAISNKVEAAYHRTDLLDHRRPMMQAWSDFVMGKPKGKSMADSLQQHFNRVSSLDSPQNR